MPMSEEQMIAEWQSTKAQLAILQDKEKELRAEIIKRCFDDESEGTRKSGNLKARFGMTRTVTSDDLLRLQDEFLASGIPLGDVVQFKPSLNMKAYRALTVDQQRSFDRCLVVKPSSPTLEVIE